MVLKAILVGILAIWNVVVYSLYAIDKKRAKNGQWRIKEMTLLFCAVCFGGIGATLGMRILRHKTQHTQFKVIVPIGLVITLAALAMIVILK